MPNLSSVVLTTPIPKKSLSLTSFLTIKYTLSSPFVENYKISLLGSYCSLKKLILFKGLSDFY